MRTRNSLPKSFMVAAIVPFLLHLASPPGMAQEQKPELCELIINLKQSRDGGFATLYLLRAGGEMFVPVEIPIATTREAFQVAEFDQLEKGMEITQRECIDDFFTYPFYGTQDHATEADKLLAYLRRINPEEDFIRVGTNHPADGEVGYFGGLAAEWQVSSESLKEFNNVADINRPGTAPLFHPEQSTDVKVIFVTDADVSEYEIEELINATTLLPMLIDREGSLRLHEYVPDATAEPEAEPQDSPPDDSQPDEPTAIGQWLIGISGRIRNLLWNPIFQAFVLGCLSILATIAAVGYFRDLHEVSKVRSTALARRLNPFKKDRIRDFEQAAEYFRWQNDVMIQFMNLVDSALGKDDKDGFFVTDRGKKSPTCEKRSAFEEKFRRLALALKNQEQEVRRTTISRIYSNMTTFQSHQQPSTYDDFMTAFSTHNELYAANVGKLTAAQREIKQTGEALKTERIRVGWRNRVLEVLRKAFAEQMEAGSGRGTPGAAGAVRHVEIAASGQRVLEPERKELEKEGDALLAHLDVIDNSRIAIAAAGGLATATSWEDLVEDVEKLHDKRKADRAARKTLAVKMAAIASAVRDSFAVEEGHTGLTSAAVGAESKALLETADVLASEVRSLHQLLEGKKAKRQLKTVIELGSRAIRYLQNAVRTTRGKGDMNVIFELIEEEIDWINQYTNRIEEQVASRDGGMPDLEAASDLLFSDDQETRSLPSALRIVAAIRVLKGYHSIWKAQPPEVQKSLTNAEVCIEKMLSILGINMHDKVRLAVDVGTLQREQCAFSVSSGSRLLEDRLFQAEIGSLFASRKITPRSTVIDISQLGFEVSGPSAHKKPWKSRLFVAERQDLERYSRPRG